MLLSSRSRAELFSVFLFVIRPSSLLTISPGAALFLPASLFLISLSAIHHSTAALLPCVVSPRSSCHLFNSRNLISTYINIKTKPLNSSHNQLWSVWVKTCLLVSSWDTNKTSKICLVTKRQTESALMVSLDTLICTFALSALKSFSRQESDFKIHLS